MFVKPKRVKSGDPISATEWNRMVDMLEEMQKQINELKAGKAARFTYGTLADDISPDAGNSTDVNITHLTYDPDNKRWIDRSTSTSWATDAVESLSLSGERHMFHYQVESGRNLILPHTAIHIGVTLEKIKGGESGMVAIYRGDKTSAGKNVRAYEWLLDTGADYIPQGQAVIVTHHRESRKYFVTGMLDTWNTILFELTANKAYGSTTASAAIVAYTGSAFEKQSEETVALHDFDGCFSGKTGHRGIAVKVTHSSLDSVRDYEIVHLNSKAGWLRFTTNSGLSGGNDTSDIADWWGGPHYGVSPPGTTQAVYDSAGVYDIVGADAKGYAVYNDVDDRYEIVNVVDKRPLVRFTLSATLTTSSASASATITAQYGIGITTASTSITVHNLQVSGGGYLFEGASGAAGLALWAGGTNYRIIQMECP